MGTFILDLVSSVYHEMNKFFTINSYIRSIQAPKMNTHCNVIGKSGIEEYHTLM